jgi:hypothetical protein
MLNTSLITHAVSWGIGRHIYYLTPEQTVNAIKFEFIAQVCCDDIRKNAASTNTFEINRHLASLHQLWLESPLRSTS